MPNKGHENEQCQTDPTCKRGVHSRGMCLQHYMDWRAENPELVNSYSKARDPLGKLYENTAIDPETDCYNFTRGLDHSGRGRLWYEGRQHQAHKIGYELTFGPVPAGLVLDHLCENPACWNPWHLEPVTQRVNLARSATSVAGKCLRRNHPNCVCWDRTAPSCPEHGQLHWIDDWAERVAAVYSRKAVAA